MEQADHQRIYCSGIDHEIKEARHNIKGDTEEVKGKTRKAAKHLRSKAQIWMLSNQICDRSNAFVFDVQQTDIGHCIVSITSIKEKGRRAMDQDLLNKQIMREEEQTNKLRRKHLLPDNVERMALATKLTNDET